jgi:hypothetical protein
LGADTEATGIAGYLGYVTKRSWTSESARGTATNLLLVT